MLPRTQRLSTAQFNKAFEGGQILRHPLFQVRVLPREDGSGVVRAAFVAPKKLGKAAERNRLRRRLRERYRLLIERRDDQAQREANDREASLPIGCDLIFLISAAAGQALAGELDAALGQLMKRAARLTVKGLPDGAKPA